MQEREPKNEARAVPEERPMMAREEMVPSNVTPMARGAVAPALYARISIGSVVAGAFIAFSSWIALLLLGYAVGFGTTTVNSIAAIRSIGIGVAIWVAISGAIAFFLGSYAASRFANLANTAYGLWHGIATWAFATVIGLPFVALLIPGVLAFISSWVSAGLGIPTSATVTPGNIQTAATVTALAALFVAVSTILTFGGSLLGGWLGARRVSSAAMTTEEMPRGRRVA